MTLDSALERLHQLADRLERHNPELTRGPVLQARMFAATIRSASIKGASLNDALADTLKVCRKLEHLLKVCQKSGVKNRERLEA